MLSPLRGREVSKEPLPLGAEASEVTHNFLNHQLRPSSSDSRGSEVQRTIHIRKGRLEATEFIILKAQFVD